MSTAGGRIALTAGMLVLMAIMVVGCRRSVPEPALEPASPRVASDQRPLKLVVVDDPALAAAAHREWQARATRSVDLLEYTVEEFLIALDDDSSELHRSDVLVAASHYVGDLMRRELLDPMPDYVRGNPGFAGGDLAMESDLFPLPRQSTMTWGDSMIGITAGAHVFMLGYRSDVLEELRMVPPRTMAELQAILDAFRSARSRDTSSWPELGIAQPLARGWAASLFLARAAPYCKHRNRYSAMFELRTMKPSIEGADFERALRELQESTSDYPHSGRWFDLEPTDTFAALAEGRCLFAIGWPDHSDSARDWDRVRVVPLPGSPDVFNRVEEKWEQRRETESPSVPLTFPADRMVFVLRSTRSQRAAWNLAVRLTGKSWGTEVCAVSRATGPFRRSHLDHPAWYVTLPDVLRNDYQSAVRESLEHRIHLGLPRIAGGADYLDALDSQVREVLTNATEPAAALREASRTWQQITTEFGAERQVEQFHHDLGLEL